MAMIGKRGTAKGVMNKLLPSCLAASLALFVPHAGQAQGIADFYRGKTLNVLIGSGVGGGLDQVARAVTRHLGRNLPGNPTVVPKNMAGAGGLQVLNFIHGIAPKDGTTLGIVLPSLIFDPRAL